MKYYGIVVAILCFLSMVAAQDDPLSILVSEAYSLYTEATQILSSVVSAATAEPSTSSVSSSSESASSSEATALTTSSDAILSTSPESSASPSSLPSSTLSLPISTSTSSSSFSSSSVLRLSSSTESSHTPTALSPSALGTSSVLGATQETGASSPTSSGSGHDHNLEIILGTVLGALALGLFILAILLCWKHHRGQSPRHRALSPGDDEVETWRLNRQSDNPESKTFSRLDIGAQGVAPLMSQHPAFRRYDEHENPFTPIPPPPRRTAPNSRAVLTDGRVAGDRPYVNEKEIDGARPTTCPMGITANTSAKNNVIAAGLAGGAIGAGLRHNHRRGDDEKDPYQDEEVVEPQIPRKILRKPVPLSSFINTDSWPTSPAPHIDPAGERAAFSRFPARNDHATPRHPAQSASGDTGAVDRELDPVDHQQGPHIGKAAPELTAATLVHGKDDQSGTHGRDGADRSTHNPTIIASSSLRRTSNDSHGRPSSENRNSYSDVLPNNPYHDVLAPAETALADTSEHPPLDSPSHVVPPIRSPRRDSNGAPIYNDPNRPAIPSPLSTEVRRDPSRSPTMTSSVNALPSRRSLASISSTHSKGRDRSRYSFEYDTTPTPYDAYPPSAGAEHYGGFFSPSRGGGADDDGRMLEKKTIVGDSRYPLLNGPRRKSGGDPEYPLPQNMSRPRPRPRRDSTPQPPPPLPRDTNTSSMFSLDGSDFDPRDIDMDFSSNWRMSSGLPSGWQRQRRSSSPRSNKNNNSNNHGGGQMRDSGVSGLGGGVLNQGQRRLRTSDVVERERYTRIGGVGQAL
ncbi:hypothetical protein PV08_03071 [Exophiala spinifera]|uniref:Uncharacterized protein n=1 Tax=Exophiala spinifera TaxID=91928 RepID=A0A0D2A1D5_9EURO|nr:uncharacterized protein PV08_03071 [Exophiala spinifera]KIW18782.1 hypothetical protein PV08_03071 [Exophiala spinifera]